MPSFSNRRALPSCRKKEDNRERCRGRRPGNAATCRARLKGWVRTVAERSPIWGDVDLKAFCATTGYSREHATRELSKLRRDGELAFETKLRSKRGSKTARWGVIVADPDKLKFDNHSLFYDRHGNRLHNYTTLAEDGEKLVPTITLPQPQRRSRGRPRAHSISSTAAKRPRGRPRKQSAIPLPIMHTTNKTPPLAPTPAQVSVAATGPKKIPENPGFCDNPLVEGSYGTQQKDEYGAGRVFAQWRVSKIENSGTKFRPRLRKKAFAMLKRLAGSHWDNCKVTFCRQTAYRYALNALTDGHEEGRIISCYADALFVCHGLAVDKAANTGKLIFFNLSSTVTKARQSLAKDGLTRQERMANWYQKRARNHSCAVDSEPAFSDFTQLRKKIAESLGMSIPVEFE